MGGVLNTVYLARPMRVQVRSRIEAILEHDSELISGSEPFSDISAALFEVAKQAHRERLRRTYAIAWLSAELPYTEISQIGTLRHQSRPDHQEQPH